MGSGVFMSSAVFSNSGCNVSSACRDPISRAPRRLSTYNSPDKSRDYGLYRGPKMTPTKVKQKIARGTELDQQLLDAIGNASDNVHRFKCRLLRLDDKDGGYFGMQKM